MGVKLLPKFAPRVWNITIFKTSILAFLAITIVKGTKVKRATSLVTTMAAKNVINTKAVYNSQ